MSGMLSGLRSGGKGLIEVGIAEEKGRMEGGRVEEDGSTAKGCVVG